MKMKMQPEMLSLHVKMKFEKMFCSRKPWRCKQGPYESLDVFSLLPTAAVSKSLWMFLRSRVLCWAHGHHHPCPHQSPMREALLHGPVLQGWCQRGPQHAPIAGQLAPGPPFRPGTLAPQPGPSAWSPRCLPGGQCSWSQKTWVRHPVEITVWCSWAAGED